MADGEVNVKVKITSDTKGSDDAGKSLEDVGKHAKDAAGKSSGFFQSLVSGAQKATAALNVLKKAFVFLAVLDFLKNIVEWFGKLGDAEKAATAEAENLKKAEREAASTKEVEKATEAWKKLADELERARTERERLNEIEDEQRDATRKIQDAQLRAGEAKEIEEAGGNADKERLIRNKYAARRAEIAAKRATEDFDTARQRETDEVQEKRNSASEKEKQAADLDARIKRLRAAQTQALTRSRGYNNLDHGFWGTMGKSLKNAATFNFDEGWNDSTSGAGDKYRKDAEEEAALHAQEAEKLEAEQKRLRAEAAKDRGEADHLEKVSRARQSARAAVVAEGKTDVGIANREVRSAQKTIDDNEAKHADAITRKEELERERAIYEARQQAAMQKQAEAHRRQFEAQSNFDLVKANKGDTRAAAKELDDAKRNAAAADRETTALISALKESLSHIRSQLNACNAEIQKNSSQTQYAWRQQPAG